MTKDEFEEGYCERSGITIEEYHNDCNLITLPCNCRQEGCEGWAAISNDPLSIRTHQYFYG
jgi:hypothetical protein